MDAAVLPNDFPIEEWEESIWWIGFHAGKPVCYCGLKREVGHAYFNRAGVLPEARGNGLQKKMIRKRLDYCRENNIKKAITNTALYNVKSMNSLIRCGFRTYWPQNRWVGDDVMYWMKGIS
jgi:GNAT superfamily N-acetyltransferase